ncbi:SsgA family sporulation/cell division regulator [Streptomyces sp. Ag109_O5-10]|uniref:SsgA family sporulation/cell division regulator n=2 Tax=unclassified Streptomyces TaxID=2593676 RepID=UPI00089D6617|nr:Streptomyces sporulation and cell division protein, SsgA [Streptomyces sp. Ag109_O5-10]
MRAVRIVTCEFPVEFVLSPEMAVPMRAALRYEADDPYAVRTVFHPPGQGSVEWFFGRDMLAEALRGHTGRGDVRMWPSADAGRDVVFVALRAPAGSALLRFPARDVESFLRETWSAVPPGAESARLDLDAELAQLLAGN